MVSLTDIMFTNNMNNDNMGDNSRKKNISVISWRFYWWRKQEYSEKTIDLSQVTDKFYYIMLYRVHLPWAGFELTTLVVIDSDCNGSCKSNYHTITTTTTPNLNITISKQAFKENFVYKHLWWTDRRQTGQ